MSYAKRFLLSAFLLVGALTTVFVPSGNVRAAGISIDAGLTPAANRWIFRSQMRIMQRHNDPTPANREMTARMFPMVVAYGVRSDLAVMVRQGIMKREMTMPAVQTSSSGLTDFLVLSKWRLLRVNTRSYTLGFAPTLGIEIPTGEQNFTSDTWDLHLGWFASGRLRSWGMDLNLAYVWNGLAKSGADIDPGDELAVEAALARQFPFGSDADYAVAPVIECSYRNVSSDNVDGSDIANTGESVVELSPGLKVTRSSLILEGLVRVPVWQDQTGLQTERDIGFLVGIRLMR